MARNETKMKDFIAAHDVSEETIADRYKMAKIRGFGTVGASFKLFNSKGDELSVAHDGEVAIFPLAGNTSARFHYPGSAEALVELMVKHLAQ